MEGRSDRRCKSRFGVDLAACRAFPFKLLSMCTSAWQPDTHRHFSCSEVQDVAPCNIPGPFTRPRTQESCGIHESSAARALLPGLSGRPPEYTVPLEIRQLGDSSLITGVVHGDGSACEEQDAEMSVVGLGPAASARDAWWLPLLGLQAIQRRGHNTQCQHP